MTPHEITLDAKADARQMYRLACMNRPQIRAGPEPTRQRTTVVPSPSTAASTSSAAWPDPSPQWTRMVPSSPSEASTSTTGQGVSAWLEEMRIAQKERTRHEDLDLALAQIVAACEARRGVSITSPAPAGTAVLASTRHRPGERHERSGRFNFRLKPTVLTKIFFTKSLPDGGPR